MFLLEDYMSTNFIFTFLDLCCFPTLLWTFLVAYFLMGKISKIITSKNGFSLRNMVPKQTVFPDTNKEVGMVTSVSFCLSLIILKMSKRFDDLEFLFEN